MSWSLVDRGWYAEGVESQSSQRWKVTRVIPERFIIQQGGQQPAGKVCRSQLERSFLIGKVLVRRMKGDRAACCHCQLGRASEVIHVHMRMHDQCEMIRINIS